MKTSRISLYFMLLALIIVSCAEKDSSVEPLNRNTISHIKGASPWTKAKFLDSVQELRNQYTPKSNAKNKTSDDSFKFSEYESFSDSQIIINNRLTKNYYYNDLAAQIKYHYKPMLKQLIGMGKGSSITGGDQEDNFSNNSLSKVNLPEKEYWATRKDPTYHVYTVITNLGPEDAAVNLNAVRAILINQYSYPGYKLQPVSNCVNKGSRLVYGTAPHIGLLTTPNAYIIPSGLISQKLVPKGILNITEPEYVFYNGTIRKVTFIYKKHIFIATYGIGINRFLNLPPNPINTALFLVMAHQNDTFGTLVFQTMDKQLFNFIEQKRGL